VPITVNHFVTFVTSYHSEMCRQNGKVSPLTYTGIKGNLHCLKMCFFNSVGPKPTSWFTLTF